MKPISRSAGRSSTAAAAYRSGEKIVDARTGEIHDYTKKRGVEFKELIMPNGVESKSRSDFWNELEQHHKRGDAVLSREIEVALPNELSPDERKRLAVDFGREVANRYGVAADVCIHEPSAEGDERNHHAHIMLSACAVTKSGLGKKVAELDPIHCKKHQIATPAEYLRERFANLTNERLLENHIEARVDHRSLEAQGIEREPTMHLGPSVMGMVRRGAQSRVKDLMDADIERRLNEARQKGIAERQLESAKQESRSVIDLSGDLVAAKKHYLETKLDQGANVFEQKFVLHQERILIADRDKKILERQAEMKREAERQAQAEAEKRRENDARMERMAEAFKAVEVKKEQAKLQLQERKQDRGRDRGYEPGM